VTIPDLFPQLHLRELARTGRIHAIAPRPPEELGWQPGRKVIEFSIINELTGQKGGGGGTGRKFDFVQERLTGGRYKITASVDGRQYAEKTVDLAHGEHRSFHLELASVPILVGRLDDTWSPRPALVRAVPDSDAWRNLYGAIDMHVPSTLSAGRLSAVGIYARRTTSAKIHADGSFEIQPVENGRTALLYLGPDGHCLGRSKVEVSDEPGGRIDLGTISDPGGRRRVSIHFGGLELRENADLCLLGEHLVVWRQQLDQSIDEDGRATFTLLPGEYRMCVFGDARPGTRMSLYPPVGFRVPQGEGVFMLDFPETP